MQRFLVHGHPAWVTRSWNARDELAADRPDSKNVELAGAESARVAADLTRDLSCPLIGIFGNDDRAPSPEQVNQHEAELKAHGKTHEFYRYDGAGHGIFYWHRPLYRPDQAMDGWSKVFAFFGKHLAA